MSIMDLNLTRRKSSSGGAHLNMISTSIHSHVAASQAAATAVSSGGGGGTGGAGGAGGGGGVNSSSAVPLSHSGQSYELIKSTQVRQRQQQY